MSGLGQCIAEMYAAQIFNQTEKLEIETIYGIVTTGSEWRLIQLQDKTVYIDRDLYSINQISEILGILVNKLQENS